MGVAAASSRRPPRREHRSSRENTLMANDDPNPNASGVAASTTEVMVGEGGASLVRIEFFPQEYVDVDVSRGHFYVHVRDQLVKTYEACGGPPADQAHADRGGHYAEP